MDKPLIIKNVLPINLFNLLQDDLRYWESSNGSSDDTHPPFLGNTDTTPLIFKEAQTIVKYKIQKYFRYHLYAVRIHLNATFPNQAASTFHTDCAGTDQLTFVLYTSPSWNIQWGGETVMFDGRDYHYVPYIPNTGCVFPSHWEHYGASPNAHTTTLRTSLALMYKICYNNPIAPHTL